MTKYIAMEQYRAIQPEEGTVLVTLVKDVNAIEVNDAASGEQLSEIHFTKGRHAENVIGALAGMYLELGPGEYTLNDISLLTSVHINSAYYQGKTLSEFMPAQAFGYDSPSRSQTRMRFGTIAIAGRQSTPEERAAYTNQKQEERSAAFRQQKERVLAAEAEKNNLIEYDHALITVEDRKFYLNTDSPDSILATRVFEAISELEDYKISSLPSALDLARIAWGHMPVAERELLVSGEKHVFGPPHGIEKQVSAIINSGLTNALGLTRRSSSYDRYAVKTNVTVEPQLTPPATPYGPDTIPIFPPGTPLDAVRAEPMAPPSEADMETARRALDQRWETGGWHLDHQDAMNILNLIGSRSGKNALRQALKETGSELQLEDALASVHARLRSSLGSDAYYSARRNRMIGGNYWQNYYRTLRPGRRLPVTSRWQVGYRT